MKRSIARHLWVAFTLMLCMGFGQLSLAQQPCPDPAWDRTKVYTAGNRVTHQNAAYQAKWWTQGEDPTQSGQWGVWRKLHDCSGGTNQPPTANAGADFVLNEGASGTLSGSGTDTDGTITAYRWTQTAGPTVTLSTPNASLAKFTAPQVNADTTLTFQLTVTDNQGASGSDTVVVTVRDGSNQPPTANAGADFSLDEGTAGVLGGSGSDSDGTITAYRWTQTAGPSVTLSTPDAATAKFTAPQVDADTTLTFQLTVTDNLGATGSDSVVVTVRNGSTGNTPPTANAGADFSVNEGIAGVLSGSGSDTDGTIASYRWTQTAGPSVTLTASDTATAKFTAPQVNADTTLTFQLTVTDNQGATGSDTVVVTVRNVPSSNMPPTANAGADRSVSEGTTVSLTGSGTDSDGTITAYQWTQTAGPSVTLTTPNAATAGFTAPQVNADTLLTFQLTVTDNQGATGSDSVSITVSDGSVSHERCRPDGLYKTPGLDVPYCTVYDENGREKLANGTARRVIGYFVSWRTGKNGQPAYLASNIPWTHITHINYAFAHVGPDNRLSVGNEASATNPATGLTWPEVPGAEMDPAYSYNGHFNLLNRFKKLHPNVRTLVSVGGWAETGGYLEEDGRRVNSGGFYTMTTNANNTVNTAGINAFADSAVAFIRKYGFDGVDIDYEYPSSITDAGHPDDFPISNARRAGLNASYNVLMKTLRERLDAASVQDGKHYLLSIAAPASGYLLRGYENFPSLQYLDFANVMTYDLHGSWNEFVGPNAALYDDGKDAELVRWDVYNSAQYGGIGYLNTDWGYHLVRGALPPGRINMGVPYYTRGFREVTGGTNGLWGKSLGPKPCPPGTDICGNGAIGIDNIWHDLDAAGKEVGSGSNPMWHAKNLENGIAGSYIGSYGLDPATDPDDRLTGVYTRYYDSTLVAPWLWNAQKHVFLSTEDEQSMAVKAQWISRNGIGGVMFWELSGDYDRKPDGEYYIGSTLTRLLHTAFASAPPYGNKRANRTMPTQAMNIEITVGGYRSPGEQNYPIAPTIKITNRSTVTLPGGTEFQFDIPTSTPSNFSDTSGFGTTAIEIGHTGNNIGGLHGDFHRASLKLPSWQTLAPGASVDVGFTYYLPISGPSNFTVTYNGTKYAFKSEYPNLPVVN